MGLKPVQETDSEASNSNDGLESDLESSLKKRQRREARLLKAQNNNDDHS